MYRACSSVIPAKIGSVRLFGVFGYMNRVSDKLVYALVFTGGYWNYRYAEQPFHIVYTYSAAV